MQTIEEAWGSFAALVINPAASEVQHSEMERLKESDIAANVQVSIPSPPDFSNIGVLTGRTQKRRGTVYVQVTITAILKNPAGNYAKNTTWWPLDSGTIYLIPK